MPNETFAKYFIGDSFLNFLGNPETSPLFMANVTYSVEVPGTETSSERLEPVADGYYDRLRNKG